MGYNKTKHNTTQHNTEQHNTTRHDMTQFYTTLHYTTLRTHTHHNPHYAFTLHTLQSPFYTLHPHTLPTPVYDGMLTGEICKTVVIICFEKLFYGFTYCAFRFVGWIKFTMEKPILGGCGQGIYQVQHVGCIKKMFGVLGQHPRVGSNEHQQETLELGVTNVKIIPVRVHLNASSDKRTWFEHFS